jgi:hypothetical protein
MRFLATHTLLSVILIGLQRLDLQGVKAEESERDDAPTDGKRTGDNDDASTTTPTTGASSSIPCGIWLAPSTIPGAGLGMFAGQKYEKDQELQVVGDVVIPVVDMVEHQDGDVDYTFLFDEYTWSAGSLGLEHEGRFEVNCISPGFGSAANSFLPVVNIIEGCLSRILFSAALSFSCLSFLHSLACRSLFLSLVLLAFSFIEGDPDNDGAGLHRSMDPGAGAFSYYHNRKSTAKKDIEAGEELYVDYGESWFEGREMLGPIPLYHDLDLATNLFRKYDRMRSKSDVSDEIMEQVWDDFVRNNAFKESRVIGAFHHDDPEERTMLQTETLSEIRRRQSFRSTEWLEEHGTCADHIQAGPSTIKQAGRGAFASRSLPEGTIVAQMPLVHISERRRLDMFNLEFNDDDERVPDREAGLMGSQLLLNYCLGHSESTLLLCPYGPMASMVNHNSGDKANVKLQWGSPHRGNHMPELLNGSIEELESDATAKLAMELVAIRDIVEGEEIFLDYGDEWEQAWQEHVKAWKPVKEAEAYVSAVQLTEDKSKTLQTVFEMLEKPLSSSVDLTCNSGFRNKMWKKAYHKGELEKFIANLEGQLYPCDILRHREKNGKIFYTVALYDEEDDENIYKIEDIPREGIKFIDRPYTTDMFLENAFRHDIRIPNEIFPKQWLNLKQE